jgi:hypothetical protein
MAGVWKPALRMADKPRRLLSVMLSPKVPSGVTVILGFFGFLKKFAKNM